MPEYDIAERYVAMCDVLGFRDLVRDTPLREVLDTYVPLIGEAHRLTEAPTLDTSGGAATGRLLYDVFADSIVIWTDTPSGQQVDVLLVYNFFVSLCKLIGFALSRNAPIRIGVAYGECTMDPMKKLYIGKSLIDAYDAERSQNWIGGACHDSCEKGPYYEYMKMIIKCPNDTIIIGGIVDYNVPQHRDICNLSAAIDWPPYSPMTVRSILFDGKNDPNNRDPEKWENAYKYYNERIELWTRVKQTLIL